MAGWHIEPFTVNLTSDYGGVQIYYQINGGTNESVATNGQPTIATEGAANALQYWGIWDIYGTGNMTLGPYALAGIQLETTPPQGTLQINGDESTMSTTTNVSLAVSASSVSGVTQMRFGNDLSSLSLAQWQPYGGTAGWSLTGGDGDKTVYCQIQDNAGLNAIFTATITLNAQQPSQTAAPQQTPNPTESPTHTPTTSTSPTTASPIPTASSTSSPTATPQVPELSIIIVIALIALATAALLVSRSRRHS
jgi:cell division septation protein DedD